MIARQFTRTLDHMKYKIGRFTVHPSAKRQNQELRTGCAVPDSGIYRVTHAEHRLPAEVTLIQNQSFPRCSKCNDPVYFGLLRSAPSVGDDGFSITLYELPELAG